MLLLYLANNPRRIAANSIRPRFQANVGAAVDGGYAFGDIEGVSVGVDVNTPIASVQVSEGEDGQGVSGASFGPGIGVPSTRLIRGHMRLFD